MKPVLFNTKMVKSILEKRKTQTRRTAKEEIPHTMKFLQKGIDEENKTHYLAVGVGGNILKTIYPKYQIGDVLYARETFKIGAWREDGRFAVDYKASPEIKNTPWITFENDEDGEKFNKLMANTINELDLLGYPKDEDGRYRWVAGESPLKWKPSIHMPKEAARIFLEVTDVRIERLQDISEVDAVSEGFVADKGGIPFKAKSRFFMTWKDIYGWDSIKDNPFVWVYEFKQIENKL